MPPEEVLCGDGVIDDGELCDGDCPETCDDGDACTIDALEGAARTCDAQCTREPIESCVDGDGCCPSSCDANRDSDCAPECGNGVVEGNELCDGDCPETCDDGNACTIDTARGAARSCDLTCQRAPQTACIDGDGCCPAGCSPMNDADCVLDCRDPESWPLDWALLESQVVEVVNARRAEGADCGGRIFDPAPPLVMDDAAREAARCHSLDMATQDFFSHTGSNGSNFSQRLFEAGYVGRPTGENIAAGSNTAEHVVGRWMVSTGHCRNIMTASANEIGVGFVIHRPSQWTIYWTQVFGTGR